MRQRRIRDEKLMAGVAMLLAMVALVVALAAWGRTMEDGWRGWESGQRNEVSGGRENELSREEALSALERLKRDWEERPSTIEVAEEIEEIQGRFKRWGIEGGEEMQVEWQAWNGELDEIAIDWESGAQGAKVRLDNLIELIRQSLNE